MNILFIGGTGIISTACVELALARGMEVTLLNRGQSLRPTPPGATILTADIRDAHSVAAALGNRTFDAVLEFLAFTPEHIETDLALFAGRTRQYVFISSASAYHKPVLTLPITEDTPLHNPFWEYSRNKAAAEACLLRAYHEQGFPATIVRPSHTYDQTLLPFRGGYTVIERVRRGLPLLVHGDGESLWVLTHSRDFAPGLVGLLGQAAALGEAYHITSDRALSWNAIARATLDAAGVGEAEIVHAPSDVIARYDADWGASLLGDKSHSVLFDNAKVRAVVPDFNPTLDFEDGVREVLAWYDADRGRQRVDATFSAMLDAVIEGMRRAGPGG